MLDIPNHCGLLLVGLKKIFENLSSKLPKIDWLIVATGCDKYNRYCVGLPRTNLKQTRLESSLKFRGKGGFCR